MALTMTSGFNRLANTEAQIRSVIASTVIIPEPKHKPFVSKKKEAKRRLAEQERQLAELRSSNLDQISFAEPAPSTLSDAAKEHAELLEFEAQLRRDWGLDPEPALVILPEKVKVPAKAKPPIEAAFVSPKPKHHLSLVKRQIEVVLQVVRADGQQIPFYHCDPGMNEFEAELNAGRKARSYGLRVLSTINITRKEHAREV
jgi:hypothetical protein